MWVFQGFKCRNDCFLIIWIEKKILEQNSELLKKCRKSPFLTGVIPWFCSKNRTFYHVCFSGKPRKIRSLFNILDREEYFLDQKREVSKNVPKIGFFKRGQSMFLSKYRAFYHVGFLGKLMQKRLFFNIVNRKEYFLEQKNEVSNGSKRSNFSKGLVLFFGQKIKLFTMRVFGQTMEEKIDF